MKNKQRIMIVILLIITLFGSFMAPMIANADDGKFDFTVSLVWEGVPTAETVPGVVVRLVRNDGGGDETVGEISLPSGTTTHIFSQVDAGNPAYTYTVEIPNYEGNIDAKYIFPKIEYVGRGATITFTHKAAPIAVLAELEWTGGKPFDQVGFVKPGSTSVQLYRNVQGATRQPVTSFVIQTEDMVETQTGWTAEHLFGGLPRTDTDGQEYIYTIGSGTAPRYAKEESGMKITYDLISNPKTIRITKTWRGGPSEKPVATINLELRQSSKYKETLPVIFDNPVSVAQVNGIDTWREMKTITVETKLYSSFSAIAKEIPVPSYRTAPMGGNWVNGFTVTNIYRSDITATKEWVGGPDTRPSVQFRLMRQAGTGPKLQVGFLKTLQSGTTQAVWTGVGTEVTNDAGSPYRFWVDEVVRIGTSVPPQYLVTAPENYVISSQPEVLNITNTYVSPKTDVTGTKIWVDGPQAKPAFTLQLWRHIEDGEPELVGDMPQASGTTEIVEYTWTDLDETDFDGNPYIYTVDELDVPENYAKTLDGLTVTNTYVSPKTDVTGTKIWVDGPQAKPAIQLQLLRNDEELGEPVRLSNGVTEYTWPTLDLTDENGVPYVYTVDEVETPDNYIKTNSDDGLTVTNTYVIPKTDFTGTKIWVDGPQVKPAIQLQLFVNDEKLGEPVTLSNGVTEYTWPGLDLTDENGVPYVYTVDEVETPDNYIKTKGDDGLTVTNTFINAPSLAITKQVENLALGDPAEAEAFAKVGETVRYTVVVTNDGNVKLTDVYLTDDEAIVGSFVEINGEVATWVLGADGVAMIYVGDMAPGEAMTVIYDYDVVEEDEARGPFVNTATVYGTMNETSDPLDGKAVQASAGATLTVELVASDDIVVPTPGEKNNTMLAWGLVLIGSAGAFIILRRRDHKVETD